MQSDWRSHVDKNGLENRARLLGRIREFFQSRNVMEVDVPLLGAATVTDPYLSPLKTEIDQTDYFLQTSPEFFMKRLLADGSGSIYYLGKAFRADEAGRKHNPEFTMLEWYRDGFDDQALIEETLQLFKFLRPDIHSQIISYGEIFEQHIGLNPYSSCAKALAETAKSRMDIRWEHEDKNTWLDLLFSHFVEPELQTLTVVYDYPASQCALAKVSLNGNGEDVAKRFEVFWQGVELANGYWELTDPLIQQQRFEKDIEVRRREKRALPNIDKKFLAALESGLPECAGIALGVDRLLMCLEDQSDIRKVLTFPFEKL